MFYIGRKGVSGFTSLLVRRKTGTHITQRGICRRARAQSGSCRRRRRSSRHTAACLCSSHRRCRWDCRRGSRPLWRRTDARMVVWLLYLLFFSSLVKKPYIYIAPQACDLWVAEKNFLGYCFSYACDLIWSCCLHAWRRCRFYSKRATERKNAGPAKGVKGLAEAMGTEVVGAPAPQV